MKNFRSILILALVATFAFAFTSCHKDGVYNPSKKISRVFYQYPGGNKILQGTFIWNKNKLEKIDYGDGDIAYYKYDGNQLSSIALDGEVINFKYDGSKLSKIEIIYDGQMEESIVVTHDGNKISKIVITEYDVDYANYERSIMRKTSNLKGILPAATCDNIAKKLILDHKKGLKSSDSYTIEFKYDGKNIAEERWVEYGATYTYTYDKSNNPFFGLFGEVNGSDYVDFLESKNNIEKVGCSYNGGYDEFTYEYSYDGKWPTERRRIEDNNIGETYFYEYE